MMNIKSTVPNSNRPRAYRGAIPAFRASYS